MGSFEKSKPLEGTENSRSYNLHDCTAAVLYWLGVNAQKFRFRDSLPGHEIVPNTGANVTKFFIK